MPFAKGQSGNPAGRPVGSRNRFTREMDEVLTANGPALIDKIVTHAHSANPAAMRLCFDRLAPMGKNRPSSVALPPVDTPDYTMAALAEIQRALAAGEITSDEGMRLLGFVERTTRILASQAVAEIDLANRLAGLEEVLAALLKAGMPAAAPEPQAAAAEEPQPTTEAGIVNNNAETMDGTAAEAAGSAVGSAASPPAAENTEDPLVAAALDKAVAAVCPRPRESVKERLMNSVSPTALLLGELSVQTAPAALPQVPLASAA